MMAILPMYVKCLVEEIIYYHVSGTSEVHCCRASELSNLMVNSPLFAELLPASNVHSKLLYYYISTSSNQNYNA